MLLIIHNLPTRIQYSEVKDLLIAKCGLTECILDNLQNEGSGMRVTVGVGEEEDAAILVRKINGLYFRGQQLYVQDKRQKKELEQPYRTPMSQQQQYLMPQPVQGYDCIIPQQPIGMYNFPTAMPTIQNPYMAYGGHQVQPLMPQFGDYSQQPFAAAPEAGDRFPRVSPSPARRRMEDDDDSWDAGRLTRDDIRCSVSPDRPGPSWGRKGESDNQSSRDSRTERPSRPRGTDRPQDRFAKRGLRQHDDTRVSLAPHASESARGGRGGRGGHFGSSRGGHASNAQDSSSGHGNSRGNYGLKPEDSRSGNFGNNRGGDAPNAQDSRSGNFGNSRGNYDLKAEDSRSGNFAYNRGGDAPNAQDSRSGNFGNPRGNYGLKAEDSRNESFGNSRGGQAPNVQNSRSGNFGNPRGNYGLKAEDSRSGNFGNNRGGDAPNAQNSRSGNFGNTRGNYGLKAEDSRSGNYGNNRGGDSPNAQDSRSRNFGNPPGNYDLKAEDSRSGNFGNLRGNYGIKAEDSRSGNFGHSRGGDAPNAQDSRSGNFGNPRGNYGLKAEDSRSGNFGNTRGGYAPNAQNSRSGNFGNTRGGYAPNAQNSRSGNFGNTRGGYAPNAQNSRSGNFGNTRGGHAPNAQNLRSGNFGNTRGGHAPNAQNSRSGNFGNTRGNYGLKAENWRDDNFGNNRGGPSRDNGSGVGKPLKRRWDDHNACDQPQTQFNNSGEPRPKKFDANPTRPQPTLKPATMKLTAPSRKIYKATITRASGKIMYQIATSLNIIDEIAAPKNPVKKMLRRLIAIRAGKLSGGVHLASPDELIARYRAEYPESDDALVYNEIKSALAAGSKTVKIKTAKKVLLPPRLNKIPSYQGGSKKLYSKERIQQKKEMRALTACEVTEDYKRAMEEEVGAMEKLFVNGFEDAKNKTEEIYFSSQNRKECVDLCKKLIMHHVSRRVTNTGLKLVRVCGKPKPPRRPDLENFLARFQCVSLKKSVRGPIYTASFYNYDNVDQLANMEPVLIGDSLVTFKHMYLASKPKLDQQHAKKIRQQFINNLVQKSNVNLLAKDWEIHNEEEKKSLKESVDVIYVSSTKDIEHTVDITDGSDSFKEPKLIKDEIEVSVEETEENHDFLHGDFKVIDEVRESDNDDVGNVSNLEDNDNQKITDDWGGKIEDWAYSGEVNDNHGDEGANNDNNGDEDGNNDNNHNEAGNDDKNGDEGANIDNNGDEAGNDDNNGDEYGKEGKANNIDEAEEAADGNGGDADKNGQDNKDEANEEHIAEFNAEDVDLDDINEDDLEDY